MRARTGRGKTRARAKEAHQNLVRWRACDFLRNREVRDAIGAGRTGLDDLRRLADCDLGDAELKQVLAEVVSESGHAREAWASPCGSWPTARPTPHRHYFHDPEDFQ